jgi:hypothetical protein
VLPSDEEIEIESVRRTENRKEFENETLRDAIYALSAVAFQEGGKWVKANTKTITVREAVGPLVEALSFYAHGEWNYDCGCYLGECLCSKEENVADSEMYEDMGQKAREALDCLRKWQEGE